MSGHTGAGTGRLLRFMLRRERRALPFWIAGTAALFGAQSLGSQHNYDTPEKLAALKRTLGGNAAMVAMGGPEELIATIGGEITFEIFLYVAIVVALMNMFLVGRNTRADEETGRAELIRSARVGRRAPLAAALALAALSNVAIAAVLVVTAVGTGLPAMGSMVFGLAAAGVGVAFAATTAVAVQVFDHARAAYGAVGAALGAAFALRAVGDIGNGVLSWFSPIGWGHRTLPFVVNRWWPLLLPLVASGALVAVAVVLLDRRDFAGGPIPTRPGRPTASRALGTPLGLAWRLQRGYLIGWTVGLFLLGVTFGSFGSSIEQFMADNPELANFFAGGAADAVNGYFAFTTLALAIIAASYGVSAALRARAEETSGRADPILATRTSRARWLTSHVTIAIAGTVLALVVAGLGQGLAYTATTSEADQIPRLTAVALVYAPAACAIVAVAVLGFGALPRAAATGAWLAVTLCTIVMLFADVIDIPVWVQRISPFTHTPQSPLEPVTATPLLLIAAAAVALLLVGYAGLRRRDVGRS